MNSLLKILENDCKEYINLLKSCTKGSYLFRGFREQIDSYRKFDHNMDFRKPVNTPKKIHDLINSVFEPKFGWKIRNGVFCYGFNSSNGNPNELGYGKQHILFPIGEFNFVYSPDHFDIYQFVTTVKVDKNVIEGLIFKSDSIESAINSGEKEDGLSNEISINVKSYYLINSKLTNIITDFIWNDQVGDDKLFS
jgi:hypothetical protein